MKEIKNTKELQEIVSNIEGFEIKEIEGKTILDYFEGHDYIIKANNKKLFLVDMHDREDICEESFTEIVCRVSEWNEDLINSIEKEIQGLYATLDQHEEFAKLMSKLLSIKEDKKVLDNLYNILITPGMEEKEEKVIIEHIKQILDIYYCLDDIEKLDIEKIEVIGSRKNGRYRKDSDLDILIEYKDDIKEYVVFNMLNGLEIEYEGMSIDFVPVHKEEKHIKLYIKRKSGYDLKSFSDLGEGHKEFTKEMKKGDFEYLELGIDNVDTTGRYNIVRRIYK